MTDRVVGDFLQAECRARVPSVASACTTTLCEVLRSARGGPDPAQTWPGGQAPPWCEGYLAAPGRRLSGDLRGGAREDHLHTVRASIEHLRHLGIDAMERRFAGANPCGSTPRREDPHVGLLPRRAPRIPDGPRKEPSASKAKRGYRLQLRMVATNYLYSGQELRRLWGHGL